LKRAGKQHVRVGKGSRVSRFPERSLPIYDANSGFMAEKQIRNFRRPIRISGSISAGRNMTKKILSGAKNSAHASGCLGLMSKLT
jgi:hypothetical protein